MSTQSSAIPESSVQTKAVAETSAETRPLLWSVRRELWENRGIFIAPGSIAAVAVVGCLIGAVRALGPLRQAILDPQHQFQAINIPYDVAAALILVTMFITGVFYSLDALYGERRDRSILFWKSLPISDFTAVMAKASIPVVVLPLVSFAAIVATQLLILALSLIILPGDGVTASLIWSQLPLFRGWIGIAYALVAISLWHVPFYSYLMMISGAVRRATFLWAAIPALGVIAIEKVAFSTNYFAEFLKYRVVGWYPLAFLQRAGGAQQAADPLLQITAARFFSSPAMWLGLVAAVVFLAVAIRLRKYREPL